MTKASRQALRDLGVVAVTCCALFGCGSETGRDGSAAPSATTHAASSPQTSPDKHTDAGGDVCALSRGDLAPIFGVPMVRIYDQPDSCTYTANGRPPTQPDPARLYAFVKRSQPLNAVTAVYDTEWDCQRSTPKVEGVGTVMFAACTADAAPGGVKPTPFGILFFERKGGVWGVSVYPGAGATYGLSDIPAMMLKVAALLIE